MGKLFKRLPANYRAAIDASIKDVMGLEHPEIAEAYRESEAESLLECVVTAKDDVDRGELGEHLIWFRDGYLTAKGNLSGR